MDVGMQSHTFTVCNYLSIKAHLHSYICNIHVGEGESAAGCLTLFVFVRQNIGNVYM
jgi:hypothetical protein